jgi:hypothetical protein
MSITPNVIGEIDVKEAFAADLHSAAEPQPN